MYSRFNRLNIYIYPLFFSFLSHVGYCTLLRRVPCATQQAVISYPSYIQYSVYINPSLLNYPYFLLLPITISLFPTCREGRLLDHMVALSLVFKGTSLLFSLVIVPVYIPTNSVGGFPFLPTFSSTIVCRFFDDGRSDLCEVIYHCSFDLHFSNDQ